MENKMAVENALRIVKAVADAIKELGSVPSGHLYAHLCGKMEISTYEKIIGILKNAGLIREETSHMLVWIGGK